jgi:predicted porin
MILHALLAVLASSDATAMPSSVSIELPPLPLESMRPLVAPSPRPPVAVPPLPLESMRPLVAPSPRPPVAGGKNGFSWTYAELNYLWRDSDAADKTLDGVEVGGSLEIMLNLFLQASYARLSNGVDLDEYDVGIGYHFPIGGTLDLYGTASYAKEDFSGGGNDDDGAALAAGARFWLTEKLELNGEVEWANVHESAGGVEVGARWYLIDMLSFGASVKSFDHDETFAVGARVQF